MRKGKEWCHQDTDLGQEREQQVGICARMGEAGPGGVKLRGLAWSRGAGLKVI